MYFQYRLYSIIVTFINKIFLIRLWLIHGISDKQFCFEATNLHSLKHIVILSPARFPSCHGVTEQLEEAGQVPAARGSSGIGNHRSPGCWYPASWWRSVWVVLRVPACLCQQLLNQFNQTTSFPFTSDSWFVKHKWQSSLLFGKCFEVYGQSTLHQSWYFPALLSTGSCYPP